MDWKIETWDVGYYQVRNAMRAKLLPQVYSLGFLNPDVEYYE